MGEELAASRDDIGSPLRRIRQGSHKHPFMKRAGMEAAGGAGSHKQPKRSQIKEAEAVTGREMADEQPTEREIAAAKAARARLYGGEGGAKVINIQWINTVLLCYIPYVMRTPHDSRTASNWVVCSKMTGVCSSSHTILAPAMYLVL